MIDTMTDPVHVLMKETHLIGATPLSLHETWDPDVTSSLLLHPCPHVVRVTPSECEEALLTLLIDHQTTCSVGDLLHRLLTDLGEWKDFIC